MRQACKAENNNNYGLKVRKLRQKPYLCNWYIDTQSTISVTTIILLTKHS